MPSGYGSSYTETPNQRPSAKEAAMRMPQLPVPTLLPCPGTLRSTGLQQAALHNSPQQFLYHRPELGIGKPLQPSFWSSFVKSAHKSSPRHHFNPDTFVVELTCSWSSQMITHSGCAKLLLPWRRMYKTNRITTESVHHHPSSGHRISPHPRLSPECWTIPGMTPHQ